jgi:hypothetical protein
MVGVFPVSRFYTQNRQNMKPFKIFFLLMLATLVVTSCQPEADEVRLPNPDEAFNSTSNSARLLQQVTMRDGSYDNILDSSSCLTLVFPVSAVVNGETYVINTKDDLKIIERILDESEDDDLSLVYPITITLPDHTSIDIDSEDELEEYVEACTEGGFDDDIECIDFVYPIKFTVYNTATEKSEVVTVETDEQLYQFIESLEDDDLVGFKFPLTLLLSDGSQVTVNDIEELDIVIEDAEDTCDEDDDNDFDDDDVDTSEIEGVITNGVWKVSYFFDETNQTTAYAAYEFTFFADGTVVADDGVTEYTGTWHVYGDDGALELELIFDEENELLDEIAEDWDVTSFTATTLNLGDEDVTLRFQKL